MARRKRGTPTMSDIKDRLVERLKAYPILNQSLLTFNLMSEVTAETANRALKELEKDGVVERVRVFVPGGKGRRGVDAYVLPSSRAKTIDEIIEEQGESELDEG